MDIVDNQLEVGIVHTRAECVCPPQKAEYHKKHPVRPTTVEVVEREIPPCRSIGWRPTFAGSRLDGAPPLDDLCAELCSVNAVPTREVPAKFHVVGNLLRPVYAWQSETLGLRFVKLASESITKEDILPLLDNRDVIPGIRKGLRPCPNTSSKAYGEGSP